MKRIVLRSVSLFPSETLTAIVAAALLMPVLLPAAGRPNILVILSDDMGSQIWAATEISTPNLDRLAANGLRFTQFYNTARCCPTRASLLTGLYPHQAGVGHMKSDKGLEGYRGELNRRCVTIAEALRPAGYRTYAVGKWHVTRNMEPEGPKHDWPLQRGFDRYYGTSRGAGSYLDPGTLTRDNTPISPVADPEYRPDQFYYTDAISDHAVRFIAEHVRDHRAEPFFCTWPTRRRTGRCTPRSRTSPGTGADTTAATPIRQARVERQKGARPGLEGVGLSPRRAIGTR